MAKLTTETAKEAAKKSVAVKKRRAAWRLERVRELRKENLTSTEIAEIINAEIVEVFRSEVEANPKYNRTEASIQSALEKMKVSPHTILNDFQKLNKGA